MNLNIKRILVYTVLIAISIYTTAQNISETELPQGLSYPVDSLLKDWKAKNYISIGKDCETASVSPKFSDSTYIERLAKIPAVMELPYNDIVRKFIDLYANRKREQVSFMLAASNFYIPIFEEALDAYNLPLELKYLPIIESALNPSATSRAGASGLWQFMLKTGKVYGLKVNSLVDERRDPIKSTWAAARYLSDLYNIYQDWNLVIAAYNCGPGNVNKAIHRSGGRKDFWVIYDHLPRETRSYVPAFIAANYIMNYYCDHNICPMETNIPKTSDTIKVNKNVHFKQIAAVCKISVDEIKSLNPQYKREIVPGNSSLSTLRLPNDMVNTFIDLQDSIYSYKKDQLLSRRRIANIKHSRGSYSSTGSGTRRYYKIRSGDSLSTIARKLGVRVSSLKRWNNIRGTRITAGKTLRYYK